MTVGKKSYRKISARFLRMFISLFVAVSLFLQTPLQADAYVGTSNGVSVEYSSSNFTSIVSLFANPGNGKTESVSFSGRISFPVYIYSNQSNIYYASGRAYIPVTFSATYNTAGFTLLYLTGSLVGYSAPEGVTVSCNNIEAPGSSASGVAVGSTTLRLEMNSVDISRIRVVQLYFDVSATARASSSNYIVPGSLTASCVLGNSTLSLSGYRHSYESSDRDGWIKAFFDSCVSFLSQIYARQGDINNSIILNTNNMTSQAGRIMTKMSEVLDLHIQNDNRLANLLVSVLNSNSSDQIANANQNSKNEIDAANNNADNIMNSYDSTSQESDNDRFEASQKELQDTEDSLFGDASGAFDALNLSDFLIGGNASMVAAMSFVSGFLQSCYQKMGTFGTIVTSGMVVLIVSKVLGLHRFSTDGGGKGG
ncbi:MAG: hypothetical protein [Inoviridae sp.]|nr:MAG: hypothetical protein [Inoviridae sp.]